MQTTTKAILTLATLGIATFGHAEPTQEEYFADPDNQARFEQLSDMGMMAKARESMMQSCATQTTIDCDCVKTKIDNVSDETLYYESMMAYEAIQEITDAIQAGDNELAEKLKAEQQNRTSELSDIEQSCMAH